MRVLVYTALFPNTQMPTHGVFVRERMEAFERATGAEVRVVAPVPYWPSASIGPSRYTRFARVPRLESQGSLLVAHPRYLVLPKIGTSVHSRLFELGTRGFVCRLDRDWPFDLLDAHYLYPDGVAAAAIADRLGKPLVLTARGTDVNLLPRFPSVRRKILEAVSRAEAVITVCAALRDALVELGAEGEKIEVVANGVDPSKFQRVDRERAREELGWSVHDRYVLSVGLLIDRKGHHHLIDALARLAPTHRDLRLVIVGDGERRAALLEQAERLSVRDRISMPGSVPHEELYRYYGAADVFALASSREGWPNVLLEAMCCGLPVVASNVWGIPEVVLSDELGLLVDRVDGKGFAEVLERALGRTFDREAISAHARAKTWDRVAARLASIFEGAVAKRQHETAQNPLASSIR
jgi:glycosyltransferase involved in cell wall biosynthesis